MEALKIFTSTSGLRPFSLNRVSITLATMIAALAIAKLINGYIFCGFNANFYVDLPIAVILFVGCCIMPLLGLAVKREATTKCGRYCRGLLIVLIHVWLWTTFWTAFFVFNVALNAALSSGNSSFDMDPFNVCGNRDANSTVAQFGEARLAFETFRRIDFVCKLLLALAWLLPMYFSIFAWRGLMDSTEDARLSATLAAGNPAGNRDEAVVWIDQHPLDIIGGHFYLRSSKKQSAKSTISERRAKLFVARRKTTLGDASRDAEDRKSEFGSVDVRMENLCNEINEPGSNAEPQSKEAKEPEFRIVDEEEGAAKATKEEKGSN